MQRLQSEMTGEEKARLYAAINYSETGLAGGKYPVTYVSMIVSLTLRQLSFILLDDKLSDPRILKLAVNRLTAGVEQREGDQALSVKLRLDSLEALGARPSLKQANIARNSDIPVLITSHVVAHPVIPPTVGEIPGQLLAVDFEKNPLDRKADQRIYIRADPLQIVYDAETINKIVHFLAPPKDLRLQELSSQVLSSLEDVKEVTVSGLRHLASRRIYTEVKIDVRPSYFLLPDNGIFRNHCRMLLVDLGSLTVRSTQTKAQFKTKDKREDIALSRSTSAGENELSVGAEQPKPRQRKIMHATFEELKEDAYDVYEINVSSMQIVMVEKDEDWRVLRTKQHSPSHILRPLGVTFFLKRCLLHNDVNLPKILIDGCLPVFSVDLTDKVLKSLFELVDNVPFPEPDKRLTTPADPNDVLKDAVVLPGDNAWATRDLLRAARRLDRSASQSTMSSWFSDNLDDLEEEVGEEDEDDLDRLSDHSDVEAGEDALNLVEKSSSGTHISNVDSGLEGDDLRMKANKVTRRLQREAALRRRRHANLIDVKMEFVIRMIQVQILQRDTKKSTGESDVVVLCIAVHEAGTHLLKRRWDQEIHAHVGTLSVSVPSYTSRRSGEPVCLAKTKRHVEGHHLLALHLLIAEKSAPDFVTRYNNTRHHLRCEFKTLELCVHQEATLLLIDFFNNVLRDLVLPPKDGSNQVDDSRSEESTALAQWASRVGDKEGLQAAIEQATSEAVSSQQLPEQLTAVSAIESHLARKSERRMIRLNAASSATKSGKAIIIPEMNITQWLVNATLDKVTLTLCSDSTELLSTTVHGLRLDVQTTYLTMELSAVLSEFSMTDKIESTDYRKILWVDPAESIVSLQLTHFTQSTQLPENACDPDKVDMALNVNVGKMHFIFLNYFVMRVLDFMNAFQLQTKAVLNKVQQFSDSAVQQVQVVVNKPSEFRLGLNIFAQAPVIYMPQHSFSNKALMVDLGRVTFSNHFEFIHSNQAPIETVEPVPEPGVMLEHIDLQLDNLRLSRAILAEGQVKAEKGIVHPINIELHLRRNLNPMIYSAIPLLLVEGGLKSIHISMYQGDYRVVQEVLSDNFAEVPTSTQPDLNVVSEADSGTQTSGIATSVSSAPVVQTDQSIAGAGQPTPTVQKPLGSMTAVRFSFDMDSVTLDLFSGDLSTSDWHKAVIPELSLALCTFTRFNVSGQVTTDTTSHIEVKLYDIQLIDTRPDAQKQITTVLDHSNSVDKREELIFAEFTQDATKHQKVNVKLRSVRLCASMDYLLALADFHMTSYPQFEKKANTLTPITESGKLKRRDDAVRLKTGRRSNAEPPTEYPSDLELVAEIGDPELILIEDIYKEDSNCLKVTTGFRMQYTMRKELVIMDASVKGLLVVACPYNEPIGGKCSKEILSPTEVHFYSKQAINGSSQGSLHLDTLFININPGTIQLIAHIVSSVQSAAASSKSVEPVKKPVNVQAGSETRAKCISLGNAEVDMNFWDPVSLDELDLPYLKDSDGLLTDTSKQGRVQTGCDVSKVLEQMEDRRIDKLDKDIIVVRLRTMRVVLESQIGTRSIPMLVLESAVDGEVISPNTALELKLTLDLSLSYYNDTLNQWEQLLETLPDEGDRMWSIQVEMYTSNMEDLIAEEDMDEVGCLQASTNSILLVSRDNLELTLSKSALDLLCNLGQSFEAAYRQQYSEAEYELGVHLAAPYRIQNKTGRAIALRMDPQALHVMDETSHFLVANVRKSFAHSIRLQRNSTVLGRIEPEKSNRRLSDLGQGTYLLASGQEVGLVEPKRVSRPLTIRSMSDKSAHHTVWATWASLTQPTSGKRVETALPLRASSNLLLHLVHKLPKETVSQKECQSTPVVAEVTTHLGMRVIQLRSTVQIVNDTSDTLCLYSRALRSSSNSSRPGRLATLDAGEIYAVPVDIINSLEVTGLFIGPDVGTTTMSTTAAYWPEYACGNPDLTPRHSVDLVYLTPLAERTGSVGNAQTLQTISAALKTRNAVSTAPFFNWPVQLMECKSKASDMVYYYTVTTLHATEPAACITRTISGTSPIHVSAIPSECYANDFQMIVRNSVILHNQLPIPINYVISDGIGEIAEGGQCTMRTVSPSDASIDVWFDYDNRVYRGKLRITPNMDELTVATFESREGYELLTLHLGLRNAAGLGQVALTLYAPYWMINKTAMDLTYKFYKETLAFSKSVDDSEVSHPASFSGALLYSSVVKSMFGKRKFPALASVHTSSDEEYQAGYRQNCVSGIEVQSSPSSVQNIEPYKQTQASTNSLPRKKHTWWNLACHKPKSLPVSDAELKKTKRKHANRRSKLVDVNSLKLRGKHKASLRVGDSTWSDKFSLDTVGSSGRVNCKTNQKTSFEIGVKIDLSSSGLTKIVTLMPYFMLVNKSSVDLECSELDDSADRGVLAGSQTDVCGDWIKVPAGEAVPFWPKATTSKKMLLRCRINENLVTDVFPFYESHSILMKLPGKYAGVFVEVQTNEEATVITLQLYQEGMALVRIVNHLGDCQPIYFHQRGLDKVHQLDAGMAVMYTWDCPRAERELVFCCTKNERPQSSRLTMDSIEEFYVNDTKAYWVSFIWNMQRVLLFTQDVSAAKNARLSADLEKIDQEIILSLQSIGLSLVDNYNRAEVAYLSVTSSGVRWSQVKRGNRLKPLKPVTSESLERAYTSYVDQLRAGEPIKGLFKLTDVGRPVEVDFGQMMMLQPDQCELRRAFEPGVFMQYKNSTSQMQLHTKIFRVQLDNQKMDCTFPVVLAPYPQPKSVALDSGPKPLLELSAIIARTTNPGSFRFKYFRVLIQEMMFKLDQGFLNDMFDFFGGSVTRLPEEQAFKRDCLLIQNRLIDSQVVQAHLQDGNRSIFDNLHISPIKIHVSFSLTGSTGGKTNAFPSEVLNLFLQSLGVALTDVQDVIFKLAYFEHQACIMTINQMISEVTRHYVSQGIRQMYVLVLGLDVLGNPFGVLRGMAQGVEDLFYEPVKGAVLGPEEFAEGVALGVKSLFGHAVGGAAGAVSRITGTIGKGVAALTLDEDYKRLRREQLARRPDTFGAGLAQGGRGLVMGVFHGVTGLVMKPVEGAKKEGFEGFFKGVGKGLIGAVTRPVSGVVDFASSSFEGIRRIADTVEDIGRVRPPRFIRVDGIIRPYERQEAAGHMILRQLDKDNNYGHYVYHVAASRGNNFLLLTTSHLLVVECMDLLGTWTIHWQTKLNALAEVPVVNRSGILISLKEKQKKLFNSGHQTRQFDCEPSSAMAMVHEIDLALSRQENWTHSAEQTAH
ncbi:hypothetical protein EG68_04047 [Paragonimus skrjabini miyazakii]|uniref:Uncharacterized protein n=1 Tax=Paragonimus skrjabini miyazakii TaxID=59628 RepID=A0A8S9YET1_9TREM|nr:hypothetical protein EG68_04047 [Paragonimus skrjabini miyazakii]